MEWNGNAMAFRVFFGMYCTRNESNGMPYLHCINCALILCATELLFSHCRIMKNSPLSLLAPQLDQLSIPLTGFKLQFYTSLVSGFGTLSSQTCISAHQWSIYFGMPIAQSCITHHI